jgi:hypothetical protein
MNILFKKLSYYEGNSTGKLSGIAVGSEIVSPQKGMWSRTWNIVDGQQFPAVNVRAIARVKKNGNISRWGSSFMSIPIGDMPALMGELKRAVREAKMRTHRCKTTLTINRVSFPFKTGLRVAKMKYKTKKEFLKNSVLDFSVIATINKWKSIKPIGAKEALKIKNIEQRRVIFQLLGPDTAFKAFKTKLVDDQTIPKATRVNSKGELESFDDRYRLYCITDSGVTFYILKCNCTSTGREYNIYIEDIWSRRMETPDAIEAVAWTIQVDIRPEDIQSIIRQGDCILVETKEDAVIHNPRHLTKSEYLSKVVAES